MTPLPCEPLCRNNFEVEFIHENLSERDNALLSEQLLSISNDKIVFAINTWYDCIIPFPQLDKIKNEMFVLKLKLIDRTGQFLAILYMNNCSMNYTYDQIFDFSYDSTEIHPHFEIEFSHGKIELLK